MKLYIVNDMDRPYERHIAEERDGKLFYIHPELRDVKCHHGMDMSEATPLEKFGIQYYIGDGRIEFEQVSESTATYTSRDGTTKPRDWQGDDGFSIPLPRGKA